MYKLLLFFLFPLPVTAQDFEFERPDYQQIAKDIRQEDSVYFYDSLMVRYQKGDTSLTIDEFRHLYYGYTYQEAYSPDTYPDYLDSLKLVVNQGELIDGDFNRIIYYLNQILAEKPFNIEELNILSYAYEQLGDSLKAQQANVRLSGVIEAILSSGDGLSEETAWHVIEVSHEYDLLEVLGMESAGIQTITDNACDRLELMENDYALDEVFFDVKRMFTVRAKQWGME